MQRLDLKILFIIHKTKNLISVRTEGKRANRRRREAECSPGSPTSLATRPSEHRQVQGILYEGSSTLSGDGVLQRRRSGRVYQEASRNTPRRASYSQIDGPDRHCTRGKFDSNVEQRTSYW